MSITNDSSGSDRPRRHVVAYLAHPVSSPDPGGLEANLANARAWLKWLVDRVPWAISAPWIPYVESLPESEYRGRGLADDLVMLERHDLIILVGGRISNGMEVERGRAIDCGLPVLNLTWIAVAPPTDGIAAITAGQHLDAMARTLSSHGSWDRTMR